MQSFLLLSDSLIQMSLAPDSDTLSLCEYQSGYQTYTQKRVKLYFVYFNIVSYIDDWKIKYVDLNGSKNYMNLNCFNFFLTLI